MGDLGLVERVLALQLSQSTWTEKLRIRDTMTHFGGRIYRQGLS